MATADYPLEHPRRRPREFSLSKALSEWVATVDHKRLGLMYMVTAIIFLLIAGSFAAVMRMQLAVPNNHVVAPDTFNRLFTMHGTTMVFLVGMPILAGMSTTLSP